MLVGKDIRQIFNQLAGGDTLNIPFDGSEINIKVVENSATLSLTALVYDGGNYIPPSVRGCLSRKSPFFHPSMQTFLKIDEQKFQIELHYQGQAQLTQQEFREIFEEFGNLANEWRVYLEDHDKHDLIYVRVK